LNIVIYQSSTVFTAILFEGLPFLLFGALVGAAVEVFVPRNKIVGVFSPRWYGTITGALGGFIFPTCECASVPISSKLMRNGAHPRSVIAFLYAAPVLNPVVLASTYVAFGGDLRIVALRSVIVGVTALLMGFLFRNSALEDIMEFTEVHDVHSDHTHTGVGQHKLIRLLHHTAEDFVSMSVPFLIGALFVVLFRAMLGFDIISDTLAASVFIVPVMMLLAILLSVCSEADAFIAASLRQIPVAGQIAFITMGPMIDIKLILQYHRHFKRGIIPLLISIPVIMVLVTTTVLFIITNGELR